MLRSEKTYKKLCAPCPIARVASLIGDTWIILIVRDLLGGSKRFGDLLSGLDGISSRTLSNKLKVMEEEGLINRNDFGGMPPKVEYKMTEKGKHLAGVVDVMRKYGEKYLKN